MATQTKTFDQMAGIHTGISWDDYLEIDAVTPDDLWMFQEFGPALAHEFFGENSPTDPGLSALSVLDPQAFDLRYAIEPPMKKSTKGGAEAWKQFEELAAGKERLGHADGEACLRLRETVKDCTAAVQYLGAVGEADKTILWRDRASGVACKARLAWYIPQGAKGPILVHFESVGCGRSGPFELDASESGLYFRAAMIEIGLESLTSRGHPDSVVLAYEPGAPYRFGAFRFGRYSNEAGREQVERNLLAIARCQKEDDWPDPLHRLQEINVEPHFLAERAG